jgi:serine/threonine protein kinase
MPLTPGTRLGLYEIVTPLGTSGMGEVYRARDTRLGRDIAGQVGRLNQYVADSLGALTAAFEVYSETTFERKR